MTVSVQDPINRSIANGVTTVFPYQFQILQSGDLVVTVDGVVKALTTDYTLTGVGDDGGGDVTFLVAPANGAVVVRYRAVDLDRSTDYQVAGDFLSSTVNPDFDRLWLALQDVQRNVERCIRIPVSDNVASADIELSPISNWLNKYITIDSTGKPVPAVLSSSVMTQESIGGLLYPRTPAESLAGVTPVNYYKEPGYTIRYGTNTTPGTTDMTAALNALANVCRAGNYVAYLPEETCLVSGSVNFSGITVRGTGPVNSIATPHIKATSAQFDVITSTGNTTLEDLYIHGGWDGATAGLTGDGISFSNGTGFAYDCHLKNVKVQYAKRNQLYWKNGGYSSIRSFKGNASGLHGLVLFGADAAHQITTIEIDGYSTFSDTPNGYGADLYQTVLISFDHVIMENTKGIRINGPDHRSLSFRKVYQEGTIGGAFFTDNASDGIGLTFDGLFGAGATAPYFTNWQNVTDNGGHSQITMSAVPYTGRVVQSDSGEVTTATTGGTNFTAGTLSLSPGTWLITSTMQVQDGGGATIVRAGIKITGTVGDSGLNINTNVNFTEGCDECNSFGTSKDGRLHASQIYQNLTSGNVNIYLRGYINISAGTIAYRGFSTAVRLQ